MFILSPGGRGIRRGGRRIPLPLWEGVGGG